MRTLTIVAALICALGAQKASAQGFFEMDWQSGPVNQNTNISGVDGGMIDVVASTIVPAGLLSVEYGEKSDDPCQANIEVVWGDKNPQTDSEYVARWRECAKRSGQNRTANFRSLRKVTVDPGRFINRLKVCLNRAGNKIKGIQITQQPQACLAGMNIQVQARIGGGPVMTLDCTSPLINTTKRIATKNCATWSPVESRCPAGQAAKLLRVSYRLDGNRKIIQGLGLGCQSVRFNPNG